MRERDIIVDDVEAWSVGSLLELIDLAAKKHNVSIGKVGVNALINVEYVEGEGDFEGFRQFLNTRRLAYEVSKAA